MPARVHSGSPRQARPDEKETPPARPDQIPKQLKLSERLEGCRTMPAAGARFVNSR